MRSHKVYLDLAMLLFLLTLMVVPLGSIMFYEIEPANVLSETDVRQVEEDSSALNNKNSPNIENAAIDQKELSDLEDSNEAEVLREEADTIEATQASEVDL